MLAVFLDSGQVLTRQVDLPRRPPGFARMQLRVAGICNTDLELQRGYYGFTGIPGHEFVGQVVEADSAALIGRRVVGEINLACGHCEFCAVGLGRHCGARAVLGIVNHPGAFAEYLTLPESNLYLVPDHMSDEQAVFVEPLAAACEILEQVSLPARSEVAVLGLRRRFNRLCRGSAASGRHGETTWHGDYEIDHTRGSDDRYSAADCQRDYSSGLALRLVRSGAGAVECRSSGREQYGVR
jgi:hypothetical protein